MDDRWGTNSPDKARDDEAMISGKARLAGVMGWPVAHSLSPRLHGYWLKRYGIDGAYVPLAVRPDDLLAALSVLPKLGFSGVNLTVPHKETAIAGLDRITSEARQLGAVNTVRVDEAGRLVGSNTDGFDFSRISGMLRRSGSRRRDPP